MLDYKRKVSRSSIQHRLEDPGTEAGKSDSCCNTAAVSLSVLQMSFTQELGDGIGKGNYSSML